jgi:hypothetical protein
MGTWQSASAINVHCCSIKRDDDDDMLSDDERADGEAAKEGEAVCIAHPLSWRRAGSAAAPPHAPPPGLDERSLPRSVSHATTVPVGLTR